MTTTTAPQRRTIAEGIRQQMIDSKRVIAWRGDPDLLLGGFEAATTTRDGCAHPFARIDRAIAAMNASALFRRAGCIRACDSRGAREILHPVFVLVERDAAGENGAWGGEGRPHRRLKIRSRWAGG